MTRAKPKSDDVIDGEIVDDGKPARISIPLPNATVEALADVGTGAAAGGFVMDALARVGGLDDEQRKTLVAIGMLAGGMAGVAKATTRTKRKRRSKR